MPTPTTQDEQFGEVHLVTSTGASAASYPTLDGLEADAYTHIKAFLHLGDGNPVKPEDIGLGTFAPYFNEAARGLFIAKAVVTDLRAALDALHPAPTAAS